MKGTCYDGQFGHCGANKNADEDVQIFIGSDGSEQL